MTIMWCMAPDISSGTDRIFCHFGLLFTFLCPPNNPENQIFEKMKINPGDIIILHIKYHKSKSYDIWFLRYGVWQIEFFSFWIIFCPFTPRSPTNNPKNQNFEKMKRTPRDIIILHKCTVNDNHMIYGSWDIDCNRQIFFVILGHFLPFTPPPPPL